MRGEVRAVSLTKMQLRSERAVALILALEAVAREPRTRESIGEAFARAVNDRMMELGWTLKNIRATVERELREI